MKLKHILDNRRSSIIVSIVATLIACYLAYKIQIPNPVIVLVVVMIFFTAMVNNMAGAASGICIIFYALFFFSENHSFIHFNNTGLYKCCIIVFSLLAIYVMVMLIRQRKDDAYLKLYNITEKLEEQNKVLEVESDHDALTGLYNRRGGDRKITEIIVPNEKGTSKKIPAIMAVMDIDNFKGINDVYGHVAGDVALEHFSTCLTDEFPDHSILVRNGGDEFQLFLYGRSLSEIEKQVVAFSKKSFSFKYQDKNISFNISCGYSVYPTQAETQADLYRKADSALYTVKVSGKHSALKYTPDVEQTVRVQMKLSTRNILKNLPVSFMVYKADESEEILLVSASLLKLCECSDFKEFKDYTGGTFHGFIHPKDVDRVEKSIKQQLSANRYGLDEVNYRIITKKGNTVHIHDLGRLVNDVDMGDLFYVVVYDKNFLNQN